MPPEKISKTFAENLQRLIDGETLNASAFGNKRHLNALVEDRAVVRRITGRNRAQIFGPDPALLRNYLRLHFGITDLKTYIELLDQKHRDGEDSLRATDSTKTLRKKSLQGFFVKAFSTELTMDGKALGTLPAGVEYFVHQPEDLRLSKSVLVVGVENPECFIKADRLLHLFPQQELLFVLRYHSNRLIQWVETLENSYLHFGDFDPAGIAIYCNEYLSRLGETRCHFLVPDGIDELLEMRGLPELYDRQIHQWPPKQKTQQPELVELIRCMNRVGKGIEQEQLLIHNRG